MSKKPEPVAPAALVQLYRRLPEAGRRAFLELLGPHAGVEGPRLLSSTLPEVERLRFAGLVGEQVVEALLPALMREAVRLARESPDLADDELVLRLDGWLRSTVADAVDAKAAEAVAEFKRQKYPKSQLGTIRRNIEILDRHAAKPELTYGQLAHEFHVTRQYIDKVIKAEAEWRRKLRDATE